jgi:hypothetical protein
LRRIRSLFRLMGVSQKISSRCRTSRRWIDDFRTLAHASMMFLSFLFFFFKSNCTCNVFERYISPFSLSLSLSLSFSLFSLSIEEGKIGKLVILSLLSFSRAN